MRKSSKLVTINANDLISDKNHYTKRYIYTWQENIIFRYLKLNFNFYRGKINGYIHHNQS